MLEQSDIPLFLCKRLCLGVGLNQRIVCKILKHINDYFISCQNSI